LSVYIIFRRTQSEIYCAKWLFAQTNARRGFGTGNQDIVWVGANE